MKKLSTLVLIISSLALASGETQFPKGIKGNLTGNVTGNMTGNASTSSASDHAITSCGTHQWAAGQSTSWSLSCSQPGFSDLSGTAATSQIPSLDFSQITTGTVPILQGGTGQTTANGGLNALLPTQTGNSSKALITDGTNTSWGTVASSGGGSGPKNFVINPSGANNAGNWTLTNGSGTGAFIRDTTAGTGIGGTNFSLKFTAAGSGDYVTSDAMTLDNDVTGNCQVSMDYMTAASVYSLALMNGSTTLNTLPLPISATYQNKTFNYQCASGYSVKLVSTGVPTALSTTGDMSNTSYCLSPSSTTNVAAGQLIVDSTHAYIPAGTTVVGIATGGCSAGKVQMSAGATGTATGDTLNFLNPINFGNATWGKATNIGSVAQATFVGGVDYGVAPGAAWSRAANTQGDLTRGGTASGTGILNCSPDLTTGGATCSNISPGEYRVEIVGSFYKTGAVSGACRWTIFDGTSRSNEQTTGDTTAAVQSSGTMITGRFNYTTAQSSVTFRANVTNLNSGNCQINTDSSLVLTGHSIRVYRFPTTSEQAVRMDQSDLYAGGKWAGGSNAISNASTWATANGTFGTRTLLGQATAGSGNNLEFTAPSVPPGKYLLFFNGQMQANSGTATVGESTVCNFAIYDGVARYAGTSAIGQTVISGASAIDTISHLLGEVEYSAQQNNKVFSVQFQRESGGGTCYINNGSANRPLEIGLVPISRSLPAFLLTGGVTSNSSGMERVERAAGTCSTTASLSSTSAGFTIGNLASGECPITIPSGVFSDKPTCTVSAGEYISGYLLVWAANVVSNTSVKVSGQYIGSGNATILGAVNNKFNLTCQGPR